MVATRQGSAPMQQPAAAAAVEWPPRSPAEDLTAEPTPAPVVATSRVPPPMQQPATAHAQPAAPQAAAVEWPPLSPAKDLTAEPCVRRGSQRTVKRRANDASAAEPPSENKRRVQPAGVLLDVNLRCSPACLPGLVLCQFTCCLTIFASPLS